MRRDRLKSARFAAGRARWRRPSGVRKLTGIPMRFTVGPRPDVGSQPSHTENTKMSISPTQKVGSENPRIEPAMMILPAADRGFRPAQSPRGDRKSTRLNSSHTVISYAVFCLKKKKKKTKRKTNKNNIET